MATHDVDETVLTLIGSGQADTRPAIVKQTGLAASTVSAAVSRLVEAGVIAEADESVSTGGRRARRLVTSEGAGALALVELGAHHGLVALTDPTRGIGRATSLLVDIADGPEAVLTAVMEEISRQEKAAGVRVGGLALAVPGPVD
ncbi:MAG: ROK family protein, partial [Actinomyces bouchesdurhonensis]|nr:ROK family protein [Actinomyces bouchesdurhonensis]